MDNCFLCRKPSEVSQVDFDWFVHCPMCGWYVMSLTVQEDMSAEIGDDFEGSLLPYLSAHVVQNSRPSNRVRIGEDWKQRAGEHARTPIGHKTRRLLELISKSASPGHAVALHDAFTAPLIDARDRVEVRYLLSHLEKLGYLEYKMSGIPAEEQVQGHPGSYAITLMHVNGWEAISPVAGTGVPGTSFVAMSFDPSLNEAYDTGIVPAVEGCGFEVVRLDRVEHNDDITDKILAGIRSSEFMVADFTLQRAGVYYEAGFARGLGRTVIWTCREDDFENLHFDTRQRNHIRWTTPTELRNKLADRIRATVSLPATLTPRNT